MTSPRPVDPAWADLLLDALKDAERRALEVLAESESYRACLLEALRQLHDERLAHARTRARLQELARTHAGRPRTQERAA